MKICFIGLGRMGSNMVLNLIDHDHKIVGYNRTPEVTRKLVRKGMVGAYSLDEVLKELPQKKIIWLMVPAGKSVDETIAYFSPRLKRGDILIDGGNSFFKDSQRRAKALEKKGIHYLDVGTSGGIEGARKGACMMVGGEKRVFKKVEVLFRDMCVKKGYGYMGESGAGHFVKMVHNGIEYGMMGAINEGMKAVEKHSKTFGTDLKEVAKVYAHGSIIESSLMSWLYDSFMKENYLDNISCEVPKGETEDEMRKLEKMAEMRVLNEARKMRVKSRKGIVCGDFISAMRNQFGGHKVKRK
jgi:6-phosphogluconate dehydrogenase